MGDDKTGKSSQDEPKAVPEDGEILVLKANRYNLGVLPIAFLSFFYRASYQPNLGLGFFL